jgi:hypothetical protein
MKKLPTRYDYNQSPFYKLMTKKKLAALLKISLEDLHDLQGLATPYRRAWLHKTEKKNWLNIEPTLEQAKNYRPIDLPDERLKKAQKIIETHFARITVPENVYSPVKGRSYVDNAAAHRGALAVYSMDIESYFPNTSRSKVIGFFRRTMCCPDDVAVIMANIVMKDDGLPQGSPCSPVLAYHSNREMWDEITELATSKGCLATIYADDLTMSGDVVPQELVYSVRGIIKKYGMNVKTSKDKSSYKRPSKITGVVVRESELLLPNGNHKKLKDAATDVAKAKTPKDLEEAIKRLRSRQAQQRQIEAAN